MKYMFKVFAALLMMWASFVYADDKSYTPPSVLRNCAIDSNNYLKCDFDNTFVLLNSFKGPVSGDYYFTFGEATPPSGGFPNDGWVILYNYENPNTGNTIKIQTGFYSVIKADIEMPGTHWHKYEGRVDDQWLCDYKTPNPHPNPSVCAFTHTPWTEVIANSEVKSHSLAKLSLKKNGIKQVNSKHISLANYASQGRLLFTNNTDYSVTLHIDDYNTGYINLTAPTVPPHSTNMVVGSYQLGDTQSLHFDAELGPGDRNTSNTTLFILDSAGLTWINMNLLINDTKYSIWPVWGTQPGDLAMSADPVS